LPVLTCAGSTFAGRVAGSLLRAVGLPELVTDSLPAYEELGLGLAREPRRLAALRERLARNRLSAPLFDTGRFRRNIEAAYAVMAEGQRQGERPRDFAVDEE
jgi:predicted O-linked N-acetylglucosamine transferase (SPINDLY family)